MGGEADISSVRHMHRDRRRDKKQEARAQPSYLSSSDGHLGLLIYRLVTETAYHQQPRPSAHARREGLIGIFEGKTHARTHTLHTNPGLSLRSIVWLRLLLHGVTASRWLAPSCASRTRPPQHADTQTYRTVPSIGNICTVPIESF